MLPELPLDGKPPKSLGEIRHVLKAIMNANPPRAAGPYQHGLPSQERKEVMRAAERQLCLRKRKWTAFAERPPCPAVASLTERQAEELLARSRMCGAIAGSFLGANLAFALTTVVFIDTPVLLAAGACIPLGFFVGDFAARRYLAWRWPQHYKVVLRIVTRPPTPIR